MPDYSLVPVDYQPDFDGYSLVPVDHDRFPEDGATQQAQIQQARAQAPPQGSPLQPPATGAGQPDAGAPAAGGGPSGSQGGGIGPTGGAPHPTLDRGAAKAAPFGGYSLAPVDYQPDFDGYYPFAADGLTQQAQIQQPPTPTQPAQPQPQTQPQQPATGAGQPDAGAPVAGDGPSGSGGVGIGPTGGAPNPASDQVGAEPAPFGGYANPTPTESLVNKARMDDLAAEIDADLTGRRGSDFEGGKAKSYRFVTTKPALDPHQIGEAGITFIAISPFHANDGARTAIIDASPEHPLRVTVTDDGKLTISPP